MIKKSRDVMEDEYISKDPQREVAALLKNIKHKKGMLDELNEDLVNTIEEKIDEEIMRTSEFNVTIDEVAALLKNIKRKKGMLDELNEDLVNTIEEKIDEEIMRTSEFNVTIDTVSFIESYLSTKCALSVSEDDDKSEGSRKRCNKVNLPKLTIKKFNGDATAWVEFIDTYTVAIHDNEDLTAVEKFNELCLVGLTLTAPNYKHEWKF